MNFLFKLLLTFNATSLIVVVFFVKEQLTIKCFCYDYVSYILYILIPVFLTYTSIFLSNRLSKDSMVNGEGNKEIEQANNAYLPSYLGYFFVALSIPRFETLAFVFLILFVFTFLSQTLYFNPLFLLFGYNFYYITTENNIKIFIITKKKIKNPKKIVFEKLNRINDFTFIDANKL